MSKGFRGFPGNMQDLVKQAQKLQQQIEQSQADAEKVINEGSTGGGMVKVTANGKGHVLSISIARDVVNPDDIEMLQDLIMAAVNEAIRGAQQQVKDQMEKIAGGMPLPGLF